MRQQKVKRDEKCSAWERMLEPGEEPRLREALERVFPTEPTGFAGWILARKGPSGSKAAGYAVAGRRDPRSSSDPDAAVAFFAATHERVQRLVLDLQRALADPDHPYTREWREGREGRVEGTLLGHHLQRMRGDPDVQAALNMTRPTKTRHKHLASALSCLLTLLHNRFVAPDSCKVCGVATPPADTDVCAACHPRDAREAKRPAPAGGPSPAPARRGEDGDLALVLTSALVPGELFDSSRLERLRPILERLDIDLEGGAEWANALGRLAEAGVLKVVGVEACVFRWLGPSPVAR